MICPIVTRSDQVLDQIALGVPLAAGETHVGEVGGRIVRVSASFTRPNNATPYAVGDIVSNSTTATTLVELANFFRVAGGSAYLVGLRLETNLKSITPRFRVHFFSDVLITVSADNVLHQEVYADAAKRRGYVDLPAMSTAANAVLSNLSRAEDFTIRRPIVAPASATSLYAALETLDIFTPAALQQFTLIALVDQN